MQKILVSTGSEFGEQCIAQFDDESRTDTRLAVTSEGPGCLLAMDELLTTQLDKLRAASGIKTMDASVLDREHMANQILVMTYFPMQYAMC